MQKLTSVENNLKIQTSYLCTIASNPKGKIYEFLSTFSYLFILFKL
jgi:hypothetical protein